MDSGSLKGDHVRYKRWPLYAGQLNSKYKGLFLGSCSVTVRHTATAIYRAVIGLELAVKTTVKFLKNDWAD